VRTAESRPNPQLVDQPWSESVPRANAWYRFNRWLMRAGASALWRIRVFNRHYEPPAGGTLYISNHQSFLDPMLVGFGLQRPMNYMARDTLFDVPGLRWWIRSVNAFPVKRGKADTGAIKEAMRRLKNGKAVTVYAEGTRTRDGSIGKFLPGVVMLAQRAADWIVPVCIEGAYDAWPRTQPVPSLGAHIVVQYAPPISREQATSLPAKELLGRVRSDIVEMQTDLRRRLGKPPLQESG
jgi:1-acyl-sn-glycerol-3-phosphate acyltransferase